MVNKIESFELIGNSLVKRAVVSNYGASILELEISDRYGDIRDVVLGFDSPEAYENNPAFFGVVVGPVANRTKSGKFTLNSQEYSMEINEGKNNLHFSFDKGLHKRVFNAKRVGDSVVFEAYIADMEDGLPGDRKISVTYAIEGDALSITYAIDSDKDTVFNPTNHSYFNLNGQGSGEVYGHLLKINADSYCEVDSELIPTGTLIPLKGSDYDYTQFSEFIKASAPIDHNFCRSNSETVGIAAELMSLSSGIHMTVTTDLPGIQVYTGENISPLSGKAGASYDAFSGIALETQFYPNSINEGTKNPAFKLPIVKANEAFKTTTKYEFKNR